MKNENHLLYCDNLFNYNRLHTHQVVIGSLRLGDNQPIRIQSMTNTSTMDTESSVAQASRIFDAGGELVRLTAQGVREAENLKLIRKALSEKGYMQPISADIHFNPNAAELAAQYVEKVRINPGNFVDAARTFRKLEYTDEEYQQEIQKIRDRLLPLLSICRSHHTVLRLGVNHGSLSDRIMSRYGNSAAGMVESCMEFLRICREVDFNDVVISIKASNTLMMVQAVRLFVSKMKQEGMDYPLHLGVTEAGDGEDGRLKSAVGIGALLSDGIGDTIRVSLSEAPENEVLVARKMIDYIEQRIDHKKIMAEPCETFNSYEYSRRETFRIQMMGDNQPPVVIGTEQGEGALHPDLLLNDAPVYAVSQWLEKSNSDDLSFLKLQYTELTPELIEQLKTSQHTVILLSSDHVNAIGEMRAFFHMLLRYQCKIPVVIHRNYQESDLETFQIKAAADLGVLFLDGFGDGLFLENTLLPVSQVIETTFGILQASRVRVSKTEYIACPGCGRTMFDLQSTLARVKYATQHLVGLKIGVMGCVVNGPGEMADSDFGYVGAGKGRISLYHRHECVEKNIPEEEAVEKLLAYIGNHTPHISVDVLYVLNNDDVTVFEVKRLDLPESIDSLKKYQWFFVDKHAHTLVSLTFRSMVNGDQNHERDFTEGSLQFDDSQGVFTNSENKFMLTNDASLTLEDWVLKAVNTFFVNSK
ncbi:(E)-4-hydroxy-3-methylbut-2-enyl-diphosphate synthase [Microbacter margulisiae]|uniref:4-hydroxy-3-methylbut-2-en-1-yl diphosphate synthase (flavodoxin) n=1 Tax=Microbacter margulisiae TaxID=1350067 RepID=A0A7W5DP70_9PORP|nr:(E)-4-hydroxy-3-methylbut-2-enyl-diphosphate synthase [Microbacter margulisiae]